MNILSNKTVFLSRDNVLFPNNDKSRLIGCCIPKLDIQWRRVFLTTVYLGHSKKK